MGMVNAQIFMYENIPFFTFKKHRDYINSEIIKKRKKWE